RGVPHEFVIEGISRCNLYCPMCPREVSTTVGNKDMEMETFRRILERVRGHASFIWMAGLGEPMMNKHFLTMVREVKQAGIAVGAFLGGVQNLSKWAAALFLGGILAAAGYSFWLGVDGVGQTYFVGIAVSASLLLWSPRLPRWIDVRSISECMLGVYLVHILFDRMYFAIHGIPELAQPLLTFGTSLLLVWLLRRFVPKVARYVV
ncbi:MAG: hypothetical protein AAB214_01375, partial [Fibrobacterota bacterium]